MGYICSTTNNNNKEEAEDHDGQEPVKRAPLQGPHSLPRATPEGGIVDEKALTDESTQTQFIATRCQEI